MTLKRTTVKGRSEKKTIHRNKSKQTATINCNSSYEMPSKKNRFKKITDWVFVKYRRYRRRSAIKVLQIQAKLIVQACSRSKSLKHRFNKTRRRQYICTLSKEMWANKVPKCFPLCTLSNSNSCFPINVPGQVSYFHEHLESQYMKCNNT